jgi:hypothetical protein
MAKVVDAAGGGLLIATVTEAVMPTDGFRLKIYNEGVVANLRTGAGTGYSYGHSGAGNGCGDLFYVSREGNGTGNGFNRVAGFGFGFGFSYECSWSDKFERTLVCGGGESLGE